MEIAGHVPSLPCPACEYISARPAQSLPVAGLSTQPRQTRYSAAEGRREGTRVTRGEVVSGGRSGAPGWLPTRRRRRRQRACRELWLSTTRPCSGSCSASSSSSCSTPPCLAPRIPLVSDSSINLLLSVTSVLRA